MNPTLIAFLLQLAMDAPHLAPQGAKLFADVAHGEGGAQKVGKALSDLAGLFTEVAPIVASAQAAPIAQQQPQ
jgi:hypothetical protein